MYNIIHKIFLEHPHDMKMSYIQHLLRALHLSYQTGKASLCLLIHSIFPVLFKTSGTTIIRSLHTEIADFDEKLKELEK